MTKFEEWVKKFNKNIRTYCAYHLRVNQKRGKPKKCEHCGTISAKKFEWANKTGKYDDINDYIRLCTSCHRKMDGGVNFFYDNGQLKIKPRKCVNCGKQFQPKSGMQKFCGTSKKSGCSLKRYNKRHLEHYYKIKSRIINKKG